MKKKEKITLCSSSFLLPDNKNWIKLEEFGDLVFSDYGTWSNLFLEKDSDGKIFFILCIDDLIEDQDFSEEKVDELFETLIGLLTNRLNISQDEVILAYCYERLENSLWQMKSNFSKRDLSSKIHHHLKQLEKSYPHFYSVDLNYIFAEDGYKLNFDKNKKKSRKLQQ